jgi:hypothetical protein
MDVPNRTRKVADLVTSMATLWIQLRMRKSLAVADPLPFSRLTKCW